MSEVDPRAQNRVMIGRRRILAIAGSTGLFALAGCTLDIDAGPSAPAKADRPDPDIAAVGTAVVLLDQALEALQTSRAPAPAMIASRDLHQVHRDRLRGVAPMAATPSPGTPTATARAHAGVHTSRRALREGEDRLVRRLGALAQQVDSGDLARLFAAMAAATAQRLTNWPAA